MRIDPGLVRDTLRSSLWVAPALGGLAALVLAEVLVAVDRSVAADAIGPLRFDGGADSARGILTTIASAMLSFTGLVFTVTMLVLQLASNQLSPRVTRTFLRDRTNQAVLALFVATFVYALVVLRSVRGPGAGEFVPSLATSFAFVLLLASVGAFVVYIDHMARSIRASSVIASVADETRAAIERRFPPEAGDDPGTPPGELPPVTSTIAAGDRSGVVVSVDRDALVEVAEGAGIVLEVVPRVGDFVAIGSPLARVRGDGRVTPEAVRNAVTTNRERTMDQDVRFGFRQLVDIASRALSPGTNDPTTAVQVLDEVHDLLRRIAGRRFPPSAAVDAAGQVRVVVPEVDWDELVALSLDEIRLAGIRQPSVTRRLDAILADLDGLVPDPRRPPIRRQRGLLAAAIERAYPDEADRQAAVRP